MKPLQFFPSTSNTTVYSASSQGSPKNNHVPDRSEIDNRYKWGLEDIYSNEDHWNKDFENLRLMIPSIEEFKGKLAVSVDFLLRCLQKRDEIGIISGKLYAYARMHRDENSTNTKYQAMTDKVETLLAEVSAHTSFIDPEILAMPEKTIHTFLQTATDLKPYQFYIDDLIRQKHHVLSPAEEEILSRSADVTRAPQNIFSMLSQADMQFPTIEGENGEKIELSEGRYTTLVRSTNRSIRQQAFHNLFTTYNKYRNTFAATLSGNVKKNIFYAKTRKYKSTLNAALDPSNVPVDVYNNIIATISDHLSPLHRYIDLKKKVLKINDLHMYDLYVPIAPEIKTSIPYNEGIQLVKESLQPLGPEYGQILEKGLSSGWVDVYENRGKRSGAYCWGTYQVHPFVLLNYNDRYDAVSTLAHELGHALHSYYSHANQPYITSSYTIFSAEVASTTNEILLLDYMLKKHSDAQLKIYLINQFLEQVRTTVYRQTLFAEFEKALYERAENGESITADMLDDLWHNLNVKYYGSNIVVDKEIDVEWARIPHFYSYFYVYQYVTGYSAATSIANKILTEGQPACESYLTFLKSGGSDYSISLLKQAGVDMSSPQPIEITLSLFSQRLNELEKLLSNS